MSKREFLQHKLIDTVIKTDGEGKPMTAGQLGLTKRETLEAIKEAKIALRRASVTAARAAHSRKDGVRLPA